MSDETFHVDAELVGLDEIYPYVNNPKDHPDSQIDSIVSSIKNTGFDQPIVVDGEGEIIKGHGRLQAAERLDLDRVPVIRRDDLSDAEAKAARIADNKASLDSGWDIETLGAELDVLDDSEEFALEATGFEEGEAESIIETAETDIDDFFSDEERDGEPGEGEGDEMDDLEDPEGDGQTVTCPECFHEFEVHDDEGDP